MTIQCRGTRGEGQGLCGERAELCGTALHHDAPAWVRRQQPHCRELLGGGKRKPTLHLDATGASAPHRQASCCGEQGELLPGQCEPSSSRRCCLGRIASAVARGPQQHSAALAAAAHSDRAPYGQGVVYLHRVGEQVQGAVREGDRAVDLDTRATRLGPAHRTLRSCADKLSVSVGRGWASGLVTPQGLRSESVARGNPEFSDGHLEA